MILPRRKFLSLAASAAIFPAASRIGCAQVYPGRLVRILVGIPAGGATDIPVRLIAQWLSERLGQPVVVENRPGASTNIATEAVVRSAPDGYTLLAVSPANAVNATLYGKLNFNFLRDIAPVSGILTTPSVMLIHPAFPANSVTAFIAYAKANPGKINMSSAGNGSMPHITGELFKMRAGVDLVHVPYRGGTTALTDLMAGRVQVFFAAMGAAIEHIKGGRLRALAVTSAARSDLLPDVPALAEFLPGYESNWWVGIGAAKTTPVEIVNRLNAEVNRALNDPRMKVRFAEFGGRALFGSPATFARLLGDETEKWGKVVKFAGIRVG